MLRFLTKAPAIDVGFPSEKACGLIAVGISLWNPPPELKDSVYYSSDACAVCGEKEFAAGERLSAFLNPRFEGGFKVFCLNAWVHKACFESCAESTEPDIKPS